MKVPHIHEKVIIAWAGGANIEVRNSVVTGWVDAPIPRWFTDFEYRVKPERVWPVTSFTGEDLEEIFDNFAGGMEESYIAVANAVICRYIEDTEPK